MAATTEQNFIPRSQRGFMTAEQRIEYQRNYQRDYHRKKEAKYGPYKALADINSPLEKFKKYYELVYCKPLPAHYAEAIHAYLLQLAAILPT